MKKIVDIKTEVRKGELYQIKFWSDGSTEERRITDDQMSKLMRAIMDQKAALAHQPNLTLIKGGKQAGASEILVLIAAALIWGLIMTVGVTQKEDDRCVTPGWGKYKDCYGEPVDY